MAEKGLDSQTRRDSPVEQSPSNKKRGRLFKIIAVSLLLIMVVGVGFAVGIYLRLIDMQKIADDMKLHEYPVVGRYFAKPQTNFEPVDLDDKTSTNTVVPNPRVLTPDNIPAGLDPNQANVLTLEDIQKETKQKQQEEAKRWSKMARLYDSMKPAEAAAILKQLDDNTVTAILNKMEDEQVAKILALFDPAKAADLTREMLKGQKQPLEP
ncbi:MAG TPA: magnesium transporter MgtE [Methylomusa anaerophila]|uniref:MgtE intracellular N domain protein n=1 Tax=Methylomusa anaerophila TaxID=1930071 RepID=A0A348AQ35_9FIRM|nr:magnesium transporter MgtE [Methylomusa anaerophila]BBB93183.1 MgtE intracellular N domain protein [Methylomusa anaerophila]HML86985.1 magnesium transporter MgtE [Methylomusa anaerophila]